MRCNSAPAAAAQPALPLPAATQPSTPVCVTSWSALGAAPTSHFSFPFLASFLSSITPPFSSIRCSLQPCVRGKLEHRPLSAFDKPSCSPLPSCSLQPVCARQAGGVQGQGRQGAGAGRGREGAPQPALQVRAGRADGGGSASGGGRVWQPRAAAPAALRGRGGAGPAATWRRWSGAGRCEVPPGVHPPNASRSACRPSPDSLFRYCSMAVAEWGKMSKEEKEAQARKCECIVLFFLSHKLLLGKAGGGGGAGQEV